MNLYIKYGPLAYKFNTRISHDGNKKFGIKTIVFNLFGYLFYDIGIWLIPFLYFFLSKQIILFEFIKVVLLYILLYIVYSVFYEIGYLYNDLVGKKEKNPTIHIYENVDEKFYYIQILIRIIIGILGIFLVYYITPQITKYFILLIITTQIIYLLHNLIRNYFYNFITLLGLRLMKFSLVFLLLYFILGTFDSVYYLYLTVLYFMFQNYDHVVLFNKRMGGINKIPNGLGKYCYLMLSCVVFFFLTKDILFIYYAVLYLLLFIALTPKSNFKLENDR